MAYWGEWRDPCDTSVALMAALRGECSAFEELFGIAFETVLGGAVQSRLWVATQSSRLLPFLADLDREIAPDGKVRRWPGLLIVHLAPSRTEDGRAPACDTIEVPKVVLVGRLAKYRLLSFVRQIGAHATARLAAPSGRWLLYDDDRRPRVTPGTEAEASVSDRFRVLVFEKIGEMEQESV
jgi:hypothetical protein